jgi:hypothetical protein
MIFSTESSAIYQTLLGICDNPCGPLALADPFRSLPGQSERGFGNI